MNDMEYDFESHELLQEAVDEGMIEAKSTAHEVALACIDQRYSALSEKQKAVYDLLVVPHLTKIVERGEVQDRTRGLPN